MVERVDTRSGYDRWSAFYEDDANPLPLLDEPVVRGLPVELRDHDLASPLAVEDGAFDVGLSALVADHVADLPGAFRELARITRPGGG